jgi:titin
VAVATDLTIDLGWLDGSGDEGGFVVERRLGTEGDISFAQIAQVGADVVSYADGGLMADTEYCYRVAAFNGNGTSSYSNTACDMTGTISGMSAR